MPSKQTPATVADYGQIFLTPGSIAALSSVPNPLHLDLLQIYDEGGAVVVNVTSAGVVHRPAVSPTSQCLFNRFYTRLTAASSTASIFADVFSENKARQDILQVRSAGQHGVYHIDYLGVSWNS